MTRFMPTSRRLPGQRGSQWVPSLQQRSLRKQRACVPSGHRRPTTRGEGRAATIGRHYCLNRSQALQHRVSSRRRSPSRHLASASGSYVIGPTCMPGQSRPIACRAHTGPLSSDRSSGRRQSNSRSQLGRRLAERDQPVAPDPGSVAGHRSRTMSSRGCEQQMNTLPSVGDSTGSGL